MSHFSYLALVALVLAVPPAYSKDPLRELPGPVASYARQLDQECQELGLGQVVVNENYRADNPGPKDVNGDGAPDYVVYKCMFGCSEKPFAFVGIGTPCPWGILLMSRGDQYAKCIFAWFGQRRSGGASRKDFIAAPQRTTSRSQLLQGPVPKVRSDPCLRAKTGAVPIGGNLSSPWNL